jgi:tRNA pseudouridine55 synthase
MPLPDGALIVDKPEGPTSHDVVARVRRATRTERVGHTGTLDPLASGVLPLVVGRATRLAQFLSGRTKAYLARIRLGIETDTYDRAGEIVARRALDPGEPSLEAIEAALAAYRGPIHQAPPAYSAKKIGGIRAHRLARQQRPAAPATVKVSVTRLELLRRDGTALELAIEASAGFYVRSLAHDLGARLGCGAHVEALRRTRSGRFTEADALPLAAVEAAGEAVAGRVIPPAALLDELPGLVLTDRGLRRAAHGNLIGPADLAAGPDGTTGPVRLLDGTGALVAIAEPAPGGALHPVIVLM